LGRRGNAYLIETSRPESLRVVAGVLCVVLWAAALALPAIDVTSGPVLSGWDVLLDGWQGLRRGVLAWMANPLFLLAVSLTVARIFRLAVAVSALAAAFALSSFIASRMAAWTGASVPAFELSTGFYCWLAALLALLIYLLIVLFSRHFRSHG